MTLPYDPVSFCSLSLQLKIHPGLSCFQFEQKEYKLILNRITKDKRHTQKAFEALLKNGCRHCRHFVHWLMNMSSTNLSHRLTDIACCFCFFYLCKCRLKNINNINNIRAFAKLSLSLCIQIPSSIHIVFVAEKKR